MTKNERLEFYSSLIARAAAELAGEDSKYPPAPAPAPKRCASVDCAQPARSGCGGHCARCWADRRARAQY